MLAWQGLFYYEAGCVFILANFNEGSAFFLSLFPLSPRRTETQTRYTRYKIAYHLVWIPKYRRKILTGEVQAVTKRLIAECCEHHGLALLALETDVDHIHVFISAPPRFSPALIANLLKGHSSRYLREQFPHLKKVCGKDHLWTSSYYVGTAGSVSAETIRRYIMKSQGK